MTKNQELLKQMIVETTEIQFVAESRGNGKYYLHHQNGGGAMANLVEVALIKELIEGREEWAAMKTVADAAADTAFKAAMEFMEFRQAIARALPKTWYADAPLEQRVKLLVDQWQKLHRREQQVADSLAALRASWASKLYVQAQCEWITELDTTIAALGLPNPTAKKPVPKNKKAPANLA